MFIFEFLGTTLLTIFYRLFLYMEVHLDSKTDFSLVTENLLFSFIFSYYLLSFLAYHATGAHFNPAITLAVVIKKDSGFNRVLGIFYLLAQLCGAFLGALLSWMITRAPANFEVKVS